MLQFVLMGLLIRWQTLTGESSLAIVGTELGEICFIDLSSGKDVGGTYIPVPVKELNMCRDNSMNIVYLLVSIDMVQWNMY